MNFPTNYTEIYQRKLYFQSLSSQPNYRKEATNHRALNDNQNTKRSKVSNTGSTYKEKLKKIFDLYSQLGESVYTRKWKQKKFFKLLIEMDIPDQYCTFQSLEWLTRKVWTNKISCIDFDQFVKLWYEIGNYKYNDTNKPMEEPEKTEEEKEGSLSPNKASEDTPFKCLLNNHVLKLYERWFNKDQNIMPTQGSFKDMNSNSSPWKTKEKTIMLHSYFHNKIGNIAVVDDPGLSEDYEELWQIISVPMFELYKNYFPIEFASTVPEDYGIKQLIKFCSDFDIFPYLITKDELFQIYQIEVDQEVNDDFAKMIIANIINTNSNKTYNGNFGKYFTFFKFWKCLFEAADFGWDKISIDTFINNSNINNYGNNSSTIKKTEDNQLLNPELNNVKYTTFEKICLFLERMELSETFVKINLKPYCMKCIITQEFLYKIKRKMFERDDSLTDNSKQRNQKWTDAHGDCCYYDYIIQKYYKQLHFIFNIYAEEKISLKQSRFIKILNDAGLIKNKQNNQFGLSTITADLIYITIMNPTINSTSKAVVYPKHSAVPSETINSQGVLSSIPYSQKPKQLPCTFKWFINCIEVISKKLFPKKTEIDAIDTTCAVLIDRLCQNYLNEENWIDLIYKEKENNEEFNKVYTIFAQTIFPLFNIYINNQGVITLKELYAFSSDFGLFPQSIIKTKLLSLFKNTITYGQDMSRWELLPEDGWNHQMFTDLLIQIAFEIPYGNDEPNDIDKIINLADRLSQSEGMEKIIVSLWSSTKLVYGKNFDMMLLFKENYPWYFENNGSGWGMEKKVMMKENEIIEVWNEEA